MSMFSSDQMKVVICYLEHQIALAKASRAAARSFDRPDGTHPYDDGIAWLGIELEIAEGRLSAAYRDEERQLADDEEWIDIHNHQTEA